MHASIRVLRNTERILNKSMLIVRNVIYLVNSYRTPPKVSHLQCISTDARGVEWMHRDADLTRTEKG